MGIYRQSISIIALVNWLIKRAGLDKNGVVVYNLVKNEQTGKDDMELIVLDRRGMVVDRIKGILEY